MKRHIQRDPLLHIQTDGNCYRPIESRMLNRNRVATNRQILQVVIAGLVSYGTIADAGPGVFRGYSSLRNYRSWGIPDDPADRS